MSLPKIKQSPQLYSQLIDKEKDGELTLGSNKKIEWQCSLGHIWLSSTVNRVKGSGCPYCSNYKALQGFNDIATTNPELVPLFKYPEDATKYTVSSGKKVIVVCSLGHERETPVSRLRDRGCPYCSNHRVLPGFNDIATTNPEVIHMFKNIEDSKKYTRKSEKRIIAVCSKGHEWETLVRSLIDKGCPYCSNRKVLSGFNDIATTHPHFVSLLKDPEDAFKYTAGSEKKLTFVCKEHKNHVWETTAYHGLHKHSCPYCSNRKVLKGFNDIATTHPEVAKYFNDPLEATNKTIGHQRKINATCLEYPNHRWEVIPYSLINYGCPYCSGNKVLKGFNDLHTTHPQIAGRLVNKKEGYLVSKGSETSLEFKCINGHTFFSKVYYMTRKNAIICPHCPHMVSTQEKYIYTKLSKNYEVSTQIRVGKYQVDLVVEDCMAIEYDGSYWHKDTLERDIQKTECLLDKYKYVIRVREVSDQYTLPTLKSRISSSNYYELHISDIKIGDNMRPLLNLVKALYGS